jgi:adenosylhomocysteine nucleosidase
MGKVMKIGILGAMLEEVSSIKEMMIVDRETTIAGRVYSEGRINDKEVVVVFSRWGKVAAASTTTTLINIFKVSFVLFTGVAGAVSDHLNIGDIVIGNGLYQHDMDARPFFDQFQIPLTTTIVFEPKVSDVDKAKNAAKRFIDNIDTVFTGSLLQKYSISKPLVHTGLIASGDKFISDPKSYFDLSFSNKENITLAVEMEGASVAQVCEDHNIPYIVIRVISDKADHSAVIDFQSFISGVANKYSSEIVKEYIAINTM